MKRRCEWGGCRELVAIGNRYCETHKAQSDRDYNKQVRNNNVIQQNGVSNREIAEFYASAEWKRTRLAVLSRDNFICQKCLREGKVHEGNLVHHIVELRDVGGWERRLDIDNLETINRSCHNKIWHKYS
ncbi:HNH endonuclease [Enterococcus casseliflavus]|uniref:HNH endonuclease n=1 Tax=Enterococcus TaxID=1350 RepID=UPI001CC08D6C|nr:MULTISPECIES: HNH endonuclease [Enterococcus]MBZ3642427.1 HNH endonuclease [Enterococcus casseliflavus]MCD5185859.1 HNH endonuclease [Enterococcus gallinarum]